MTLEKKLSVHTIISQSQEVVFSKMDDEIVMMNLEKGEYYGISPVGSRIWELIETPQTLENICSILCSEYDVSNDKCIEEVRIFIDKMIEKNTVGIINKKNS